MRKRLAAAIGAALTALLLTAPGASAALEAGEPCTANGTEANRSLIVFHGGDNPFMQPVVPEESGDVITGWRVRVGSGLGPLTERLEVYRVLNEAQEYRKVAESQPEPVVQGVNFFPTRIAVQGTAYLGLYGPAGTLVCTGEKIAGAFEGSAAVGETRTIGGAIGLGVPLTAVVEHDADKDGYGDETQDKCPTSAAFQGECPKTALHADAEAKAKLILVRIGVSSKAKVDVYGQVGWGYKPNPDLKTAGGKPTRLIVALSAPHPKTVKPGKRASFEVPLRKAVLRRLGRLAPKQSLTAKLTASATNLAGRVTTQRLFVKLAGRGAER